MRPVGQPQRCLDGDRGGTGSPLLHGQRTEQHLTATCRSERLPPKPAEGGGPDEGTGLETFAGDDDPLRPEEVCHGGKPSPDGIARIGQTPGRGVVAGGGHAGALEHARHLAVRRADQRPLHGRGRGNRLQAPPCTAVAVRPVTVDDQVTDLPCHTERTGHEHAVHHQRTSDAGTDGHDCEAAQPGARAGQLFLAGKGLDIVLDGDGESGGVLDELGEGDVVPVEEGRVAHQSMRTIDIARDGQPKPAHLARFAAQVCHNLADRSYDVWDSRRRQGPLDGVVHLSPQVRAYADGRAVGYLDPDDSLALGAQLDRRAGPADATRMRRVGGKLAYVAVVEQGPQRLGHRSLRQAALAGKLGAGQRALRDKQREQAGGACRDLCISDCHESYLR
jgi:hypothetical protein